MVGWRRAGGNGSGGSGFQTTNTGDGTMLFKGTHPTPAHPPRRSVGMSRHSSESARATPKEAGSAASAGGGKRRSSTFRTKGSSLKPSAGEQAAWCTKGPLCVREEESALWQSLSSKCLPQTATVCTNGLIVKRQTPCWVQNLPGKPPGASTQDPAPPHPTLTNTAVERKTEVLSILPLTLQLLVLLLVLHLLLLLLLQLRVAVRLAGVALRGRVGVGPQPLPCLDGPLPR